MKQEDLKAKIKAQKDKRANELSNGWTRSAEYTQKVIDALETHLK